MAGRTKVLAARIPLPAHNLVDLTASARTKSRSRFEDRRTRPVRACCGTTLSHSQVFREPLNTCATARGERAPGEHDDYRAQNTWPARSRRDNILRFVHWEIRSRAAAE